jgi:cytochrome c oxidase subunit IV
MTEAAHTEGSYKTYWVAWCILLILSVGMIFIPAHMKILLVVGILIKAGIIGWWFMHLKHEMPAMTVWIVVMTLLVCLLLFGLMMPDMRLG